MTLKYVVPVLTVVSFLSARADDNDTIQGATLQEVVVGNNNKIRKPRGFSNTQIITSAELKRAACCNLGESFTTNPSVDVSYNDAATGARQIRLLGLSGSYVQFLTENIPNFRGAAAPYGLGYVAGPWMQSIQVSKGASSVKNGFESITGQINVEMKKPQNDPQLNINAYYDRFSKLEANVDGNMRLGGNWSGGLLLHGENAFEAHDSNNDGFADLPKVRQVAVMPRVAMLGQNYVFQAAAKYLGEKRESGQIVHGHHYDEPAGMPLYKIGITTHRGELMTKNAYIFDKENDGNVALILSGSYHDQDAGYGLKVCDIRQSELYASLMFERKWNEIHGLSAGVQFAYDHYGYDYRLTDNMTQPLTPMTTHEAVTGLYGQYTLNIDSKILAMAGLRYDYDSRFGSIVTPRLHLRYNPLAELTVHASAGKGYRSAHPLAEYSYLLASSRRIEIELPHKMESAWNTGLGARWSIRPRGKRLEVEGEYYYTRFARQLVADLDRNPHSAYIFMNSGKSYSHTVQLEMLFEPISSLSITAAWRYTDVMVDYGSGLVRKALTSRNKGLLTVAYSPWMGKWQFDVSCAINGGGRMPTGFGKYNAWCGLNAQITRNFRHWSIYVGGENLTNYRQPNPIVGADNPWGRDFDATMIYGPLHGANIYIGFRYNITKY